MKNILTFDIEDWYQSTFDLLGPEHAHLPYPVPPSGRVVENTRRLLGILGEYGVRSTCFVLGTVAETFPGLVDEIQAGGHEVATHGYGHELVYSLTPERFKRDVARSIELLEGLTGERVRGYRAPCFSITKRSRWALGVLGELGMEYDSSIFPIRRKRYGFPNYERFPHSLEVNGGFSEVPVSTIRLAGQNLPIGGGGYFRVIPYRLIREVIRGLNKRNMPAVIYLHPYELDTEELKKPLERETFKVRMVRFTQQMGRGRTEEKLRKLLGEFEWSPIRDWLAMERKRGGELAPDDPMIGNHPGLGINSRPSASEAELPGVSAQVRSRGKKSTGD
jgi:polysaccharide deacetylase family protein (PEP-CTERM system associated)